MPSHQLKWLGDFTINLKDTVVMSGATQILAYLVLYIHFLFVLAIVLPVLLMPIGARYDWHWVRSKKLRSVHVGMMAFVLVEVLMGMICPLTWLENELLKAADQPGYQGAFIAHWVEQIMYWNAPPWVFVVAYTTFFLLIVLLWKLYPPRT